MSKSTHKPAPAAGHSLWAAEFRPRFFESIKGYNLETFGKDALAGSTVAIVAIPLALAFAIASGVEPVRGLITAIVAGFLISFLGGSKLQIGGPTGAFIVILAATVAKHGYEGLVLATIMAGLLLVIMGALRLGNYIRLIPAPVIVGFTAGIAAIIFSGQVKDFFGLALPGGMPSWPADAPHQWMAYAHSAVSWNPAATGVGLFALGIIIALRQVKMPIPPAIIGVIGAALLVWVLGAPVATIGSKFGGIPQQLPSFSMPVFTLSKAIAVIPDALAIAFLAGIESLLSALVADKMSGDKHKPNAELIGQGIANIASVMFGGIAATGAIARTGVNARSGGRTPVSGIIHAIALLLVMLLLAPLASAIPLAALAAVLFVVSWDMSEKHHLADYAKKGLNLATVVAFLTLVLTVFVDLTQAVAIGTIVALLPTLGAKAKYHWQKLSTRNIPLDDPTTTNEER